MAAALSASGEPSGVPKEAPGPAMSAGGRCKPRTSPVSRSYEYDPGFGRSARLAERRPVGRNRQSWNRMLHHLFSGTEFSAGSLVIPISHRTFQKTGIMTYLVAKSISF